jgi:hypothetical protein
LGHASKIGGREEYIFNQLFSCQISLPKKGISHVEAARQIQIFPEWKNKEGGTEQSNKELVEGEPNPIQSEN